MTDRSLLPRIGLPSGGLLGCGSICLSQLDPDFCCDFLDHRGEPVDPGGHGDSVVGDREKAWTDEGPGSGTGPGRVVDSGRTTECFTAWSIEDALGIEQVDGAVTDPDAAEVDHAGQLSVLVNQDVLLRHVGVDPARGLGGRRDIS